MDDVRLRELTRDTAADLFALDPERRTERCGHGLVFPRCTQGAGGELRISEQEARLLFTRTLDATPDLYYAIEAQTESRRGRCVGRYDVAVYSDVRGTLVANAEFKSGSQSVRTYRNDLGVATLR